MNTLPNITGAQAEPAAGEQAGAVALTDERIKELWEEHGLDECDPEGFARIIEAEVLASSVRAAPGAAIAAREQEKSRGLLEESADFIRSQVNCIRFPAATELRARIDAALASREEAPATPQWEPSLTDVLITANDGSGTTWTRIEVLELAEGLEAIASAAVMDGSKMRGEAADRDREWCRYQATYAALALRALTQPATPQAAPSSYINGADIRGNDDPIEVVRKLDAEYRRRVGER